MPLPYRQIYNAAIVEDLEGLENLLKECPMEFRSFVASSLYPYPVRRENEKYFQMGGKGSLLHIAVNFGNFKMIQYLLEKCNVSLLTLDQLNQHKYFEATEMHVGVETTSKTAAERLIEFPMHETKFINEVLKMMAKKEPRLISLYGCQLLKLAAKNRKDKESSTAKLLIEDLKTNVKNEEGVQVLEMAIKHENFNVFMLLLKSGVNLNLHTSSNNVSSILQQAYTNASSDRFLGELVLRQPDLIYLVGRGRYSHERNRTVLDNVTQRHSFSGHGKNVKRKLSHLIPKMPNLVNVLNSSSINGSIIGRMKWKRDERYIARGLFTAADGGHQIYQFLKNMIECGVDVKVRNEFNGQNLLHSLIANRKNEKSIELLLQHGLDLNAKQFDGNTPLTLARNLEDSEDLIKLLETYLQV